MTREQILAMEPGRELDALVAERVMGWTNIIRHDEYGGVYVGWPPDRRPWDTDRGAYIPRYSYDDVAALQIIPAMGQRGWDCATYYEADAGCWTVYFLSAQFKPADARAQSGLLAEAICKAALLAVLEEVDAG